MLVDIEARIAERAEAKRTATSPPPTASARSSKAEGIVLEDRLPAPHGGGNERAALHDRDLATGRFAAGAAQARPCGWIVRATLADLREHSPDSTSSLTRTAASRLSRSRCMRALSARPRPALLAASAAGRSREEVAARCRRSDGLACRRAATTPAAGRPRRACAGARRGARVTAQSCCRSARCSPRSGRARMNDGRCRRQPPAICSSTAR